ncbi:MAG: hypothetical protein KDA68_24335, partial [Planctomycetaceae bacterium]|nr:hypothetical protein [Planctomycetaceae bacterium]
MTVTCIELTAEEFERDYPLQLNNLNSRAPWGDERGGSLFETYGEELEFVRQQNPRSVWTLIDG